MFGNLSLTCKVRCLTLLHLNLSTPLEYHTIQVPNYQSHIYLSPSLSLTLFQHNPSINQIDIEKSALFRPLKKLPYHLKSHFDRNSL